MRKMLYVPANPGWERTILVILIHRREVPPLRIATRDFCHARFEINPKPLPQQQEHARANRRLPHAEARPQSVRRKKQRDKSSFQQHPVRLIPGKLSRRADERKKAKKTNKQRAPRPRV